jgi:hypothetical protein
MYEILRLASATKKYFFATQLSTLFSQRDFLITIWKMFSFLPLMSPAGSLDCFNLLFYTRLVNHAASKKDFMVPLNQVQHTEMISSLVSAGISPTEA